MATASSEAHADVVLVLEGTYPYVRGGVSKWVHDLVCALPEFRFGLLFIGATEDMYGSPAYEMPPNVSFLLPCHLLDLETLLPRRAPGRTASCYDRVREIHRFFQRHDSPLDKNHFSALVKCLSSEQEGLSAEHFYFGEMSWDYICDSYSRHGGEEDFVAYFWTVRTMHAAVWKLARFSRQIARCKVIHSVSTGYAGLLASLLCVRDACPFILTEHGIYTKERKIDLQGLYISDGSSYFSAPSDVDTALNHDLWIRFFEGIGRIAYANANPIIALSEGNRLRQIRDGAPAQNTRIIPNGIGLSGFAALCEQRPKATPMVLGLLGRVVPIKDVKTFIRAMRTVCVRCPDAEGWVIGPEDEDPEYAKECRQLAKDLGLEHRVKFLGFQKPQEILPKLGVLVLTSISEAFPLVILEAWASGLPVIATDVGACRDLIEGTAANGKALGHAGAVVSIADPQATAQAAVELLTNPARWRAAQEAGIQRAERYYRLESVIERYRELYREAKLGSWQESVSS
jgi:glycosyltransferase involved in cell wall biosynthesis